jgi:Family of unknown function (DUF6176)
MLHVTFRRVRPERVDALRAWMAELDRRREEVRATFRNEGVRHEQAFLIESADGPVLVYAHEVDDPAAASAAYGGSTLALDQEHREIMGSVLGEDAEVELLYDVKL